MSGLPRMLCILTITKDKIEKRYKINRKIKIANNSNIDKL